MKKILITGASGFIGNNLVKKIDKKKYDVFKIESSLHDLNDIKNWEIIPNCDYVVHLAAKTFVPETPPQVIPDIPSVPEPPPVVTEAIRIIRLEFSLLPTLTLL